MTHEILPRVCTVEEFLAATPAERRALTRQQLDLTPEAWLQSWWANGVTFDHDRRVQVTTPWHPEGHHYPTACGTAFCYAGWGAVLAGYTLISADQVVVDGRIRFIADCAMRLFGLRDPERRLFNPGNSLNMIDQILEAVDRREEFEQRRRSL
jgi:hypothetical protein